MRGERGFKFWTFWSDGWGCCGTVVYWVHYIWVRMWKGPDFECRFYFYWILLPFLQLGDLMIFLSFSAQYISMCLPHMVGHTHDASIFQCTLLRTWFYLIVVGSSWYALLCQKNLILQSLGSLFLSPIDGLLHVTIPKGKGEEEKKNLSTTFGPWLIPSIWKKKVMIMFERKDWCPSLILVCLFHSMYTHSAKSWAETLEICFDAIQLGLHIVTLQHFDECAFNLNFVMNVGVFNCTFSLLHVISML